MLQEKSLQYINKAGGVVDVVVFLFSDMILITRRSKKGDGGLTLFKPPIPLESAVFIDKSDSDGNLN